MRLLSHLLPITFHHSTDRGLIHAGLIFGFQFSDLDLEFCFKLILRRSSSRIIFSRSRFRRASDSAICDNLLVLNLSIDFFSRRFLFWRWRWLKVRIAEELTGVSIASILQGLDKGLVILLLIDQRVDWSLLLEDLFLFLDNALEGIPRSASDAPPNGCHGNPSWLEVPWINWDVLVPEAGPTFLCPGIFLLAGNTSVEFL